MSLLAGFRRNRSLVFGIVASLALLVAAAVTFDFRPAAMLDFLWACVLMIVAIIATAVCIVALLLGARALWRRLAG
jgi:hypothetical protein